MKWKRSQRLVWWKFIAKRNFSIHHHSSFVSSYSFNYVCKKSSILFSGIGNVHSTNQTAISNNNKRAAIHHNPHQNKAAKQQRDVTTIRTAIHSYHHRFMMTVFYEDDYRVESSLPTSSRLLPYIKFNLLWTLLTLTSLWSWEMNIFFITFL